MNKFLRTLLSTLCTLFIICSVSISVNAKDLEAELAGQTYWQGDIVAVHTPDLHIPNEMIDENIQVVNITSENPKVIAVKKVDKDLYNCELKSKAIGSSYIELTYTYEGNEYKTGAVYRVKKCPKAIQSVTVNGKALQLTGKKRFFNHYAKYKKQDAVVKLVPAKGWKITSFSTFINGKSNTSVKNGKTFSIKKGKDALIYYMLENKQDERYFFTVSFTRVR